MAAGDKKISFGFSKVSKQPRIPVFKNKDESNIQYIDCLESSLIKVKGNEPSIKNTDLIIPVKGDKSVSSLIENYINIKDKKVNTPGAPLIIKKEANEIDTNVQESLDLLAAREILEDSRKEKSVVEDSVLTLQLQLNKDKFQVEKEPTLEDYESIPVTDFGMAMLRGMGWCPNKGIGKNERIVSTSAPVLRPKGMGLGADKLIAPPRPKDTEKQDEDLKVTKGAFVQILAGSQKNTYGQVEGFDDSGRLIIKSAWGGVSKSINECMVKPVSQDEYKRCSRVLNLKKYEELGKKEKHEDTERENGTRDKSSHKKIRSDDRHSEKHASDSVVKKIRR